VRFDCAVADIAVCEIAWIITVRRWTLLAETFGDADRGRELHD
jgi:hypothetical protein